MKKRLLAIITVIMAIIMCFSFAGCDLITNDTEKDMDQVVATVQLEESAPVEKITKREMIMSFLSYGYYYVQQGQYTSAQMFELILESLIESRILVQNAMMDLENQGEYSKRSDKEKWDLDRYLTDEDLVDAEYNTILSMNSLIDSYDEDKNKEIKSDTIGEEVRTVPTDAANKEEKKTQEEKKEYIEKYKDNGADIGAVGSNRRKAYNNVLKLLKNNGLLGSDYKDNLKQTDYYNRTWKSNKESLLRVNYEKFYMNKERTEKASFTNLEARYEEMYADAITKTPTSADFNTQLSDATASKPVVYNPTNGTYNYVYNLLIGASEEQTALITAVNENKTWTTEQKQAKRSTVLATTKAKDLRSTWILSGYDFDLDSKCFTGDYTFAIDSANSLPFQGEVTKVTEKTDDQNAVYRVDSVKEFGVDELIEFIDNYVYGGTVSPISQTKPYFYKQARFDAKTTEYDAKMNELLFAFSTDPGSLNTFKGYVVGPKPEITDQETYVPEFAEAGRLLMDDATYGKAGYIVCETDYGYHFMYLSEILGAKNGYETLIKYLNEQLGQEKDRAYWEGEWQNFIDKWDDEDEKLDKNSYLYKLIEIYADADNMITEKETQVVAKYKHDNGKVKRFTSVYADLVKE